jgi:hypothetical protein
MALEEGEQRQLLSRFSGVGQNKLPFVIAWVIQGLEFLGTECGFETRVGGAFD